MASISLPLKLLYGLNLAKIVVPLQLFASDYHAVAVQLEHDDRSGSQLPLARLPIATLPSAF